MNLERARIEVKSKEGEGTEFLVFLVSIAKKSENIEE